MGIRSLFFVKEVIRQTCKKIERENEPPENSSYEAHPVRTYPNTKKISSRIYDNRNRYENKCFCLWQSRRGKPLRKRKN